MRLPIIAANWKMHMTLKDAEAFIDDLKDKVKDTDVEVVICPPYTLLHALKILTQNTNIKIGSQNMHFEEQGAFTGEISPVMLSDMEIEYCVIGHSERRQYFYETNEIVNQKVKSALKHNIRPILCVGETLEERKSNETENLIRNQVIEALKDINEESMKNIVIAYEPIWAIGTGMTASPEDANNVIDYIRKTIKELYGEGISEEIRIQYGGSVKPQNVESIMNMDDIDGALVGGASLKADSFSEIVNF